MEGTIAITPELVSAYDAARHGCLVVEHEAPGIVHLRGTTTLDFLHRLSTNDMTGLEPGAIRGTVLTTAIGRTVDVVQVLRRPSEVLLLTTPGRAEAVREWLTRYIFFNDDVRAEQASESRSLWGFYGPAAGAEAAKVGDASLPTSEAVAEAGDGLLWEVDVPVPGYHLLAGAEMGTRARELWGERLDGPASLAAYEVLRVEHGLPSVGAEITDDVIPLEAGLWDLVSFSKGCYIGQEVIARMESRNRVARQLVGVRLDRPEKTPQEILLGQQPIGRLTSAAHSPRLGPIGLALVRSSVLDKDPIKIQLSPAGTNGMVQHLPFDQRSA